MIPHNSYSHLTEEEAVHFLEHGWVRVPEAIDPKYLAWVDDVWIRLGMDPQDKSTWNEEYIKLPRHREVRAEEFCPKAWGKMLDIVGGEDKVDPIRERYYGDQFIINLGTEDWKEKRKTHEVGDLVGWHTDNDWYRQFLDSSGNALTLIFCFTDVPENGGGTEFAEDGIEGWCKQLYDHPEGFDSPMENKFEYVAKSCKKIGKLVAKKGDLIITHGYLPHTFAPNHLHYARIITNPHLNMREPWNLNREDGNYTLCEQVILRALNRTSIPEYKPTRDRLSYYPRTAFFKREKIRIELERMIAHAKSKGGSERDVDSIYLKGEEAILEHERRNGYDKSVGPNGVVKRTNHRLVDEVDNGFVPVGGRHKVY